MTDLELKEFNDKQMFVRDALPSNWLEYSEELADASAARKGGRGYSEFDILWKPWCMNLCPLITHVT